MLKYTAKSDLNEFLSLRSIAVKKFMKILVNSEI